MCLEVADAFGTILGLNIVDIVEVYDGEYGFVGVCIGGDLL